jgi:D-xylose transport system permease protein
MADARDPSVRPVNNVPADDTTPVNVEAAERAALAGSTEAVAESFGDYVRGAWIRIRSGESGVLPVVVGLVAIAIIFQAQNSLFLSAGNLTNLLVQGAFFMLLGMGEVFALLLGEIDLSLGFLSGLGGVIATELVIQPRGWPWWAAVIVALLATTAAGVVQGLLITILRLPSFVVTLAGQLFFAGLMIIILGAGGTIPISDNIINDFSNGDLTVAAGWILLAVVIGLFALMTLRRNISRRRAGLVTPPLSVTLLRIGIAGAAGVALVLVCNTNRGALVTVQGVPWVVLIVLGVLALWTVLLARTRFGRYVYAIGGNAEAARRAGINLARMRTACFALAGLTSGIAGLVYASRLRSVSTSLQGGTLVLYAVASAVIGGTSLFGGRGKMLHAVLGGLVIAAIYNGMGLLGMSAASQYMVTALVLLAAVTVDALARRGRAST